MTSDWHSRIHVEVSLHRACTLASIRPAAAKCIGAPHFVVRLQKVAASKACTTDICSNQLSGHIHQVDWTIMVKKGRNRALALPGMGDSRFAKMYTDPR